MLLGALEHQVFEEVRNARLADRIVSRTVAIPHHVRDDGSAMIRDHHDIETVVEGEGGEIRAAAFRAPEGRGVGAKKRL